MKYTKIVFLLFIIIQTDLMESFSKREQISYVNYSLISIEEETEICIQICMECFSHQESDKKVYFLYL